LMGGLINEKERGQKAAGGNVANSGKPIGC
jgi:hypothetical protein